MMECKNYFSVKGGQKSVLLSFESFNPVPPSRIISGFTKGHWPGLATSQFGWEPKGHGP